MKLGVIGIGRWGKKVAREYIALMNEGVIDSLILCDIDHSKLKEFADVAQVTTNIDECLSNVDGVHICTPNSTHYELTLKALNSNVNVLVEKPMAENVNQAFSLVEKAMSKGLILQVGHIFRFANIVRKIKEIYEKNTFGELYYIRLSWTHKIQPIKNTDVIYDLLPHPLDIINFITGKWPEKYIGTGRSVLTKRFVEVAFIDAIYDTFHASIHLSWLDPIKRRELVIVGSKATLVSDCVKQWGEVHYPDGTKETVRVEPNNTIRDEALNFIESIKTGRNNYNSSIIGVRSIVEIDRARDAVYDSLLRKYSPEIRGRRI